MNCIELLNELIKECDECRMKSFVIEYDCLPEDKKVEFGDYDDSRDFIVHCSQCDIYRHLKGDISLTD